MTIILTGGHPTPAFALIEYLQSTHPEVRIVFIGRTTTRSSDHQPSPEQMMANKHQVRFFALDAPKFGFGFSLQNIWRLFLLLISTIRAWFLVQKIKPQAIVCFGSYLAVPVAVAGNISGIKVITHEQTRGLGRANQVIARFAHTLALSHPSSQKTSARQTQVVGNLLRPSLFAPDTPPPSWLPDQGPLPLLYITGGEQGSEIINATVAQVLPQLLKHFVVVHQCGPASQTRNYAQELMQLKSGLPPVYSKRYSVREWLTVQELSYLYHHQTLVLARSGANTIDELTAFRLPSVLVPLPFSQGQEQHLNALSLVERGAALLLEQKDLTPDLLMKLLLQLKHQTDEMKSAFPHDIDYTKACAKLWQVVSVSLET